eukprot:1152448-Pelagomonas_calceolata.AAC.2
MEANQQQTSTHTSATHTSEQPPGQAAWPHVQQQPPSAAPHKQHSPPSSIPHTMTHTGATHLSGQSEQPPAQAAWPQARQQLLRQHGGLPGPAAE